MRTILRNFAMALVATAMLGGYMAYGQDIRPRRAVDTAAVAPTSPASLPLGIGDKLKISFYETIDVQAAKQGSRDGAEPQGPLRTFYQRMDLSGDYAIEQDGAISIPLLGRFLADGRALDDVRGDLAVSFTSVMGRSANIDVKILDRSPIYVVGAVKTPGAYKHVPGMIVLHAVALAGGLDRGDGNLSGMIEGVRESERLRSLTLQVKQLLARRSRLEAERDGESILPVPVQLANLAGERTARTFLAAESTILRAEQARRLQQAKEIALKVASGRNEVEALKRKLDQIEIQKNMRTERLDDLQKLKDRGWVTSNNVVILRTELSDIESRRQDYVVAIVQAEARLAEAEQANARLSSETTENLANAMATVDKEVAVAQEAMVSARTLATVLSRSSGSASQTVAYEIVRQSKDGARTLQATETSPLMPGDVLKINPSGAAAAIRPSSMAPLPQPDPSIPYVRAANEN
ncbi:MAG: polysaccharide biosynthesis/export protein ExoF [Paraburkholderia sp.]|jgi:protein involved in polysaccharide export with SLBB domain|uniref:polysaccharide biosynthesis/export family protein n=1 Tax=Paraburkholderia sp. TaxID=1926495 RepID=UPI002AFFDB5A|nr:polysaccharide biosynthesis/export family protein [Paraburkholderia sp.]MEA3083900.1 polysaccharide biosynthesis/export protein ExoF [Paraburkholderia sp.]